MENIAFDLVKKYPPVEPQDFASGRLMNEQFLDFCVEDGGNRCVYSGFWMSFQNNNHALP